MLHSSQGSGQENCRISGSRCAVRFPVATSTSSSWTCVGTIDLRLLIATGLSLPAPAGRLTSVFPAFGAPLQLRGPDPGLAEGSPHRAAWSPSERCSTVVSFATVSSTSSKATRTAGPAGPRMVITKPPAVSLCRLNTPQISPERVSCHHPVRVGIETALGTAAEALHCRVRPGLGPRPYFPDDFNRDWIAAEDRQCKECADVEVVNRQCNEIRENVQRRPRPGRWCMSKATS
jgi:hypothetical protein